jgi:hypothetical protein
VALQTERFQFRIVLKGLLEFEIGEAVELRVGVDSVSRLVHLHRAIDRIELALRILAKLGLLVSELLGLTCVFEHRFSIALHALQWRQRRTVPGEHGLIGRFPFRLEIGRRGIEAVGVSRPGVNRDPGNGPGNGCAVERRHCG